MTGIKDAKCVLVIGATAGIGRALSLAIHKLDSKPTVIVAGRRQDRLDELKKQGERIKTARVDIITTHDKLKQFVDGVLSQHPNVGYINPMMVPNLTFIRSSMPFFCLQVSSTSLTSRNLRQSTSAVSRQGAHHEGALTM